MNSLKGRVPVLEIGGTHVTAAIVDGIDRVPNVARMHRIPLDSGASRNAIVRQVAKAASLLDLRRSAHWGVAIPGPFDYAEGVGRFGDVGKFDYLSGVDFRGLLQAAIVPSPIRVSFLNDADAFGIGEVAGGAAIGHDRAVCLTLGTGVGSAFIADGLPVNRGELVPPDGSVHLLTYGGQSLEETVSRRAIRKAYARGAIDGPDVYKIAALARGGDLAAIEVFRFAMHALGETIAPWVHRFEATALVIGGSIARSWDVLEAPLRDGLMSTSPPDAMAHIQIMAARFPEEAPLIGTATWLLRAHLD